MQSSCRFLIAKGPLSISKIWVSGVFFGKLGEEHTLIIMAGGMECDNNEYKMPLICKSEADDLVCTIKSQISLIDDSQSSGSRRPLHPQVSHSVEK